MDIFSWAPLFSDVPTASSGLVVARKNRVSIEKIEASDITKFCTQDTFEDVSKNSRVSMGKIDASDVTKYCNKESFENTSKSSRVSVGKIDASDVTKYCNGDSFEDTSKNSRVSIGKIDAKDITQYCKEGSFENTSKDSVVTLEKMEIDDDDVFEDKTENCKVGSIQEKKVTKDVNAAKNWKNDLLRKLIEKLQKNDALEMFANPVDIKLVPDYLEMIKKPMDFTTMREKLENSEYETVDDLEIDFNQMMDNCMEYNKKTTVFHKTARKLKIVGWKIIAEAKEKMETKSHKNVSTPSATRKKAIANPKLLSTPTTIRIKEIKSPKGSSTPSVVRKIEYPGTKEVSTPTATRKKEIPNTKEALPPAATRKKEIPNTKEVSPPAATRNKEIPNSKEVFTPTARRKKEILNPKDLSTPSKEEMSEVDKLLKLMSKVCKVDVNKKCTESKVADLSNKQVNKFSEKPKDIPIKTTQRKVFTIINNDWHDEDELPEGWQKKSKSSLETKKLEHFYKCPLGCIYKSTTEVEKSQNNHQENQDEIVEIPRYMVAFDLFVTRDSKLSNSLKQKRCVKCEDKKSKKESLEKVLSLEKTPEKPKIEVNESALSAEETIDQKILREELENFFKQNNLPLQLRELTQRDGNSFFRAIADQIILHQILGKPTNHHTLRHAICSHLKHLPDKVTENIPKGLSLTVLSCRQRKSGQYVDDHGIMMMATALFLNRNIDVYSGDLKAAESSGDLPTLSKIDGGEGAEQTPSLTVFYYKDFKHYQSISKVEGGDDDAMDETETSLLTVPAPTPKVVITEERYKHFMSLLYKCFTENNRAQDLEMPVIKAFFKKEERENPYSNVEIDSCIEKMEEENKVMLADQTLFMI